MHQETKVENYYAIIYLLLKSEYKRRHRCASYQQGYGLTAVAMSGANYLSIQNVINLPSLSIA